jgi:hypothetical protein
MTESILDQMGRGTQSNGSPSDLQGGWSFMHCSVLALFSAAIC